MCRTGDTSGPVLVSCAVGYIMLTKKKKNDLPPADILKIVLRFFNCYFSVLSWLGSENKN